VRVREAIALAVPRQQIFEAISDGTYEVADSYLPNRHWAHADVTPITYDPVRAAALLDDAGFFAPPGGGTRARTDGTPLRLTVDAGSDKEETEELLSRVKGALANVGIELVIRLRPFKELSAALASERALRQITFYAWASDPSIVGGSLWRADRIPRADNGYKGANTTGYQNDVVTQLLKEVEVSVDVAARQQKLAAVQQQLRRDLPVLPLYVRPQIALSRKGVFNLRPTGTLTPLAWNAAQWDVAPRAEP
jgi:peptide/nickel transport system substrate-binding protein